MIVEKLAGAKHFVSEIIHISDIHIRLNTRHDEYRSVFSKLYKEIESSDKNSIIINTGDTLHAKITLSPEAVQLVTEFFTNLAKLRPLIVIPGNHDTLLNAKSRLDSITPIVEAMDSDNIYYLKKSKLYAYGDLLINNMSVFDLPDKYINCSDIPETIKRQYNKTIAVYHGVVNGSKTPLGETLSNALMPLSMFSGVNYALLGDIHLPQTYSIDNTLIRYAGTVVQQNFGEPLTGHGYSKWNLSEKDLDKVVTHVEIPNDFGFVTLRVSNGVYDDSTIQYPKNSNVRLFLFNTTLTAAKKILVDLQKKTNVVDYVFISEAVDTIISQTIASQNTSGSIDFDKLTDKDYQNTLLEKYFTTDAVTKLSDDTLTKLKELNTEIHGDVKILTGTKSTIWVPIKFEFSNMFSYGENNVIEFDKLSDVYGIFAKNASGKTSLFQALCFCLFDKSDKTFKAVNLINRKKKKFSCKFTFKINTTTYVIDRSGEKDKKGNVKVNVDFSKVADDGSLIQLNSDARRSTNDVIREYIGSYDDFVLTSLALQNKNSSLIEIGNTERKELLCRFAGISIFDTLKDIASTKLNPIWTELKSIDKTLCLKNISKYEQLLEASISGEANTKAQITKIQERIDAISTDIDRLKETIVAVPVDNTASKSELERQLNVANSNKKKYESEIASEELKLEDINLKLDRIKIDSMKYYSDNSNGLSWMEIEDKVKQYDAINLNWMRNNGEISQMKLIVGEKLKKIQWLDDHGYDANCKYCMLFASDILNVKDSLIADKEKVNELLSKKATLDHELEYSKTIKSVYGVLSNYKKEHADLIASKMAIENRISSIEFNIAGLNKTIDAIHSSLASVTAYADLIEINSETNKKIATLKDELFKEKRKLQPYINQELPGHIRTKSESEGRLKIEKEKLDRYETLEKECDLLTKYIEAFDTKGIPYQLLTALVPAIERGANSILSQISPFTLAIEPDGKSIQIYIKYGDGDDEKWLVEMGSGMEQFIASIALRVSLMNTCNLPRAKFLVIDEGFSALDATNMQSLSMLFGYLKTQFDFIIIISHLESMKDIVDKQIEILNDDGFAKINLQ